MFLTHSRNFRQELYPEISEIKTNLPEKPHQKYNTVIYKNAIHRHICTNRGTDKYLKREYSIILKTNKGQ